MNYVTPEQFVAANQANLEALKGFTTQAYAGFEKLVELNLATSKALVSESFGQMQALLGAKDVQQMLALQSALFQPVAQKSAAYGSQVQSILTDSTAELSKAVEAKLAEAQKSVGDLVDNVAKNAPVGSESVVALFKNAISASQNAIESAQSSAKSAVEMASSNFTAAATQAVKAVADVTAKA